MKRFAAVFTVLVCVFFGVEALAADQENLPRLSVQGQAVLEVPADRLNLRIGVDATAEKAEQALKKAGKELNRVMKALEKVGLSKKEYETRRFDVRPQWSSRPKNAPRNWRREIVGYRASTSLTVKTTRLELGGKLMMAAAKAGANNMGSLTFDLADPQRYRDQAIQKATAIARADAESLAAAAGVKILRVLFLNLDSASPSPILLGRDTGRAMQTMAMAEDEVPELVGGDITVRASVRMVCEIAETR